MTNIGRYRLVRLLGEGGMGVVHEAVAPDGERVALKLLRPGAPGQAARRFREREARALERLRHPGVVRLIDVGRCAGGGHFLVMELLDGRTLADRLDELPDRRLDGDHAAWLVERLARALAHVHAAGVVHRDVKPSNILLRADGSPVLTDFGLATLAASAGGAPLTTRDAFYGSPPYMSPEQARGEEGLDGRSDVFSLGTTLYEALTGRLAFERANELAALHAVQHDHPPPPAEVAAVDEELSRMCMRALAKAREDRYPTAAAFADDLADHLAGRAPRGLAPPADHVAA